MKNSFMLAPMKRKQLFLLRVFPSEIFLHSAPKTRCDGSSKSKANIYKS